MLRASCSPSFSVHSSSRTWRIYLGYLYAERTHRRQITKAICPTLILFSLLKYALPCWVHFVAVAIGRLAQPCPQLIRTISAGRRNGRNDENGPAIDDEQITLDRYFRNNNKNTPSVKRAASVQAKSSPKLISHFFALIFCLFYWIRRKLL